MRKQRIKSICVTLVCMLCLNLITLVSVQATETGMNREEKKAIDALRYFAFIPDYYDYNTNVLDLASRADFIAAAAKIAGFSEYSGEGVYYYDVPSTHWAYNEICGLTQMGVLSGTEKRLFSPDDPLKKEDAYKIVLTLMGYKEYAEGNGGYPFGYIQTARRLRMTEDLSSSDYITLGDMFLLLYHTMITEIAEPISIGREDTTYQISKTKTLMTLYHDIYYTKGVVTGADCVTLDGRELKSEEVQIDKIVYKSDVDLLEYLGMEIEFFYHYYEKADEKRIVWVNEMSNNECLEIGVDHDASFDSLSYNLSYHDKSTGKQKNITLRRGITVVYNGSVVSEKTDEIFSLPKYEAKLIKDDSGIYSLAIVKHYENIIADTIDSAKLIIYDKIDSSKKIVLDEDKYDKMSLKMLGKTEMSFSEIKQGDVLSVYMSRDEKILEVQVNAEQIMGTVAKYTEVENGIKIVINSIEYFMPNGVYEETLSAGDDVLLYLDAKGEVAYLKCMGTGVAAAYIVGVAAGDNPFRGVLKIKMFHQNEKLVTVETADKVKIDGVLYKNPKDALRAFSSVPTLALIETDQNGRVTVIDTPYFNEEFENEPSLKINRAWEKDLIYKSVGVLGAHSVVDDNTLFFVVPNDYEAVTADENAFSIMKKSQFGNDTIMSAETYKTRERVGCEQYVLLKGYSRYNYTSELPVLVESIEEIVNANGEPVESLVGYQGNTKVELNVKFGVSLLDKGVKKGMLVNIKKNKANELEDVQIVYDYHEKDKYLSAGDINGSYTIVTGDVTDIVDGVVKIGVSEAGSFDRAMCTAYVPTLVYDVKKNHNNISLGTIQDAVTYYNDKDNYSSIVMLTRWMEPQLFVIYNR